MENKNLDFFLIDLDFVVSFEDLENGVKSDCGSENYVHPDRVSGRRGRFVHDDWYALRISFECILQDLVDTYTGKKMARIANKIHTVLDEYRKFWKLVDEAEAFMDMNAKLAHQSKHYCRENFLRFLEKWHNLLTVEEQKQAADLPRKRQRLEESIDGQNEGRPEKQRRKSV